MYLFSRRAQLSGAKLRDAMGWAVAAGERVTQTTGLPIGVWSQVYSPGVGTLVWATFVTAGESDSEFPARAERFRDAPGMEDRILAFWGDGVDGFGRLSLG